MLHFEGETSFIQALSLVWDKLSDARFLLACIPDVENTSRCDRDSAACVIRPGFAFVRGKLDLTIQVVKAVESTSTHLLLHTKGIGSSSKVEAALIFKPQDGGTVVQWTAEVKELGGLLKAVPRGLIQAAAQKVIADAWTAVKAKMES